MRKKTDMTINQNKNRSCSKQKKLTNKKKDEELSLPFLNKCMLYPNKTAVTPDRPSIEKKAILSINQCYFWIDYLILYLLIKKSSYLGFLLAKNG